MCAHPAASVYANVYADVKTPVTYAPAPALVLKITCLMHATLSTKYAHAPVHAKLLCHENYCEIVSVLCKYRAGCCWAHALLLSRRNRSPDAARSRKPFESTLAHDAVAAAVSHRHHSIIRVGAGLIQMVYVSHSPGPVPAKLTLDKNLSAIDLVGFFLTTDACLNCVFS